jgi:hypothetical protein
MLACLHDRHQARSQIIFFHPVGLTITNLVVEARSPANPTLDSPLDGGSVLGTIYTVLSLTIHVWATVLVSLKTWYALALA